MRMNIEIEEKPDGVGVRIRCNDDASPKEIAVATRCVAAVNIVTLEMQRAGIVAPGRQVGVIVVRDSVKSV